MNLDPDNSKIIVCHLGNGSSISAVKNGKVVDTSMGMTPMEGLVMGTRCGDMDPTIVEYLAHSLNKSLEEVMVILNKKSGVLGISGVSSDFRDLDKASNEGNERAKLAVEVFSYRTAKYIGSYIAAMNGVDAIVFTAGLGENNIVVREQILDHLVIWESHWIKKQTRFAVRRRLFPHRILRLPLLSFRQMRNWQLLMKRLLF